METWQAAFVGAIGAILPDLLKAIRKRFQKRPAYLGTGWYWSMLAVLAVLGAVVVAFRHPADALEGLAFGAVAPVFLAQILGVEKDDHLGTEAKPDFIHQVRLWWGS
ncbi:hypothetical protein HGP17_14875 [Rhizobium sp. P38BS-XIX]|uniref:hypothetical protein n=1 Tax=Rhizobium sp. P38BS-XIX TaxID=2726740 RepID=UPI001456664F|nr:hypothetical protein [Rhizobium sp. P38BS-XIX]NLR98096.1 hypothetical protein [Rhizobium sp. P38BS-XIX]